MLLLAGVEEKRTLTAVYTLYNTCIVILKANNFDGIICSSHHLLLCAGPQPEPSLAQPSRTPVDYIERPIAALNCWALAAAVERILLTGGANNAVGKYTHLYSSGGSS